MLVLVRPLVAVNIIKNLPDNRDIKQSAKPEITLIESSVKLIMVLLSLRVSLKGGGDMEAARRVTIPFVFLLL